MTWRTGVRHRCATLRGAEYSDVREGGDDARQAGGMLLSIPGSTQGGAPVQRADTETAEMLHNIGCCERPPYLHRRWVRVPKATPMAKTQSRIDSFYDSVRGTLPRKVQSALSERSA